MKRILLIAITLSFVFVGSIESFGQTGKTKKKTVTKKLVKCYENGKRVYRTKCRIPKLANPTLEIKPRTNGNKEKTEEEMPYGISNGVGNGQGSGRGTGRGYGDGVGSGNGYGTGQGSGNGDVETETKTTPNKNLLGPTTPLKLISKPSPRYTDAARQNNVQGTISLRVTFLANGAIGGVSPINGLGYGLTEQAIAAARNIRFEPAKRNGVPYSVTKVIKYNFTIY